jgi:hypothetical protein
MSRTEPGKSGLLLINRLAEEHKKLPQAKGTRGHCEKQQFMAACTKQRWQASPRKNPVVLHRSAGACSVAICDLAHGNQAA